MPPIYWSTGSQASASRSVVGAVSFQGSVKRAKYQDEFDEGVHRVGLAPRRPPQCGQATCFQVGWWSSGLPGLSKVTSSGSLTGRSASGTGTTPQASQWITGIGQPQ